jgi:hypothetical protein
LKQKIVEYLSIVKYQYDKFIYRNPPISPILLNKVNDLWKDIPKPKEEIQNTHKYYYVDLVTWKKIGLIYVGFRIYSFEYECHPVENTHWFIFEQMIRKSLNKTIFFRYDLNYNIYEVDYKEQNFYTSIYRDNATTTFNYLKLIYLKFYLPFCKINH